MEKIAYYYFIITYIITIMLTHNDELPYILSRFLWLVPFIIWVLTFFQNRLNNDSATMLWRKNNRNVKKYILLFGFAMFITNLVSINIAYSIFSSLFIVILLYVMFEVASVIVIKINQDIQLKNIITNQLLLIQLIAILGDLTIPAWNWDSTIRLSGGVNPNMMAFISLFSFIWFLDLKIDGVFNVKSIVGVTLSVITLLWTLSRGRILGLLSLIYFLIIGFFLILLNPRLQYKFKKITGFLTIITILLLITATPLIIELITTNDNIMTRLLAPVDSRLSTWTTLLEVTENNILFGSLGWWNTSDFISLSLTTDMATSSHNFFLRVLSEIGIIGLVASLLLPTTLILKSIKKMFTSKVISNNTRKKLLLYSSGITAFFITQFFEDQYLDGIGDFEMGLFVWLFAFCFFYLKEQNYKKIYKEK